MKTVDVCAAVVRRGPRFLLATRPADSHLSGKWEFPGGKLHPGESPAQCIARELHEELDLDVCAAHPVTTLDHTYPTFRIRLLFLECTLTHPEAEPLCREGQQAGWFTVGEMEGMDLAPADRPFVEHLRTVSATPA